MFLQRAVFWILSLYLCLGFAEQSFAASSQAAEAARVIAVTPGAFVQRGNERTPLKLKDPLYKEDQVSTNATGKLQLLFADDTTVAVAPDSMVNIADFSFGGPAKASFALGVGRGLARVVTGKVVEQNREGFKVTTPHATVGIRGTILTADVRNPSQSKFILSQLGAGHTVSVLNASTGQRTEMPKAGLTTEVGAAGNVLRPATPAEMNVVQTVTRQTRQAPQTQQTTAASNNAAQGSTAATPATASPAKAQSPAVAENPSATAAESPAPMTATGVEDVSGGHSVAGKGDTTVSQIATTAPKSNEETLQGAVTDDLAGGLAPGVGPLPGGDLTPGAGDDPGGITASYQGTLQGVHESSGIGGTFSFDVNLGSGGIDNGVMVVGPGTSTPDSPVANSFSNGTGQVHPGGSFGVGNFTSDVLHPYNSASMNGNINAGGTVEVEHWEVHRPSNPGGDLSGTGSGSKVSP